MNSGCIIRRLDVQCVSDEVGLYQPIRPLVLNGLAMLEQEPRIMGNFGATVSRPRLVEFENRRRAVRFLFQKRKIWDRYRDNLGCPNICSGTVSGRLGGAAFGPTG